MRNCVLLLLLFISVSAAQEFTEIARIGGSGQEAGQFNQPTALDFTVEGTLIIVDSGNNRLQIFDAHGRLQKTIGGFGFNYGQLNAPKDVWARMLINIYVSDFNNQRLVRYDRNFRFLSDLKSQDSWDEDFQFAEISSCAINSQNDLFLLDHSEQKIIKFNRTDTPERVFGAYESGAGELQEAVQLDIFKNKYLLISDAGRQSVLMFDFFGTFIREIADSSFKAPAGLAVDNGRGFYLADAAARKIFFIPADGQTVKPLRLHVRSRLKHPVDVALWQGRLYILDGNQLLILEQTRR